MKVLTPVILGICLGIALGMFFSERAKRFANPNPKNDPLPSASPTEHVPQLPRITASGTIHAFVTAYDPYDEECVGKYAHIWPRKTATGTDAELPGVAADLAVIPAGSTAQIPDLGTFPVDDDGGTMRHAARKSDGPFYWIDIRIPAPYGAFSDPAAARKEAHAIAKRQGGHWMEVYITPPGSH